MNTVQTDVAFWLPEKYASPSGWGSIESSINPVATPLAMPKAAPLPMPKLTGVDPEHVTSAWNTVSSRYPKIAKSIKEIRRASKGELPGEGTGEKPKAAYQIGGTILIPHGHQGPLETHHLFHEITHAAQDLRGQLKPREQLTPDQFKNLEDFARFRGAEAKPQ